MTPYNLPSNFEETIELHLDRYDFIELNPHIEWNGASRRFPCDEDEVHFQLWREDGSGQ